MKDSFATWLASKRAGRFQICKMMGWSMSSKMPDRYIDRAGVVEEEVIDSIRGDELKNVEKENSQLKMALGRLESRSNELQERLDKRAEIDEFLSSLLKDENLRSVLAQKVRKNGLEGKLMKL